MGRLEFKGHHEPPSRVQDVGLTVQDLGFRD